MPDMNNICSVTLFSTRMIGEKNTLFSVDNYDTNEDYLSLDKYMPLNIDKTWWNYIPDEQKEALFNLKIKDEKDYINKKEYQEAKIINKAYETIKTSNNSQDIDIAKDALYHKYQNEIHSILIKSDSYQKELDRRRLYQLRNTRNNPVYGVYELNSPQPNRIKSLVDTIVCKTAQPTKTGTNKLPVYLVLHDKDVRGEHTRFDYYIVKQDEVRNLYGDSFSEIEQIIDLHIIFFKHTDNLFVRILRDSTPDQNINERVKKAIKGYEDIAELSSVLDNLAESRIDNVLLNRLKQLSVLVEEEPSKIDILTQIERRITVLHNPILELK